MHSLLPCRWSPCYKSVPWLIQLTLQNFIFASTNLPRSASILSRSTLLSSLDILDLIPNAPVTKRFATSLVVLGLSLCGRSVSSKQRKEIAANTTNQNNKREQIKQQKNTAIQFVPGSLLALSLDFWIPWYRGRSFNMGLQHWAIACCAGKECILHVIHWNDHLIWRWNYSNLFFLKNLCHSLHR